jgi:hypothetical protein
MGFAVSFKDQFLSHSTVRDFSHRNVKISQRKGIGAIFSHCKVKNVHSAVIFNMRELAYDKLFTVYNIGGFTVR